MKKLFVFVSLIGMVFAFSSCNNASEKNETRPTPTPVGEVTCKVTSEVELTANAYGKSFKTVVKDSDVYSDILLSEADIDNMRKLYLNTNWESVEEAKMSLEELMTEIKASQVTECEPGYRFEVIDTIQWVPYLNGLPMEWYPSERNREILTEWVSVETLPSFGEIIEKMNSSEEAWPQYGFFSASFGKPVAVEQMAESEPEESVEEKKLMILTNWEPIKENPFKNHETHIMGNMVLGSVDYNCENGNTYHINSLAKRTMQLNNKWEEI